MRSYPLCLQDTTWHMEFLAYVTNGLDRVIRHEMLDNVPEAECRIVSDKYVIIDAPENSAPTLLELKTVDELHRLLRFEECDEKPGNDKVVDAFPFDELAETFELVHTIRDADPTVSVTTSRYQNSDIDTEQLKTTLGNRIGTRLSREFTKRDHSNVDIRVHV